MDGPRAGANGDPPVCVEVTTDPAGQQPDELPGAKSVSYASDVGALTYSLHEELRKQREALEGLQSVQAALRTEVTGRFAAELGEGAPTLGPDLGLDYTDSWPQVEVTVAVNEILRLDLHDLSFEADFLVHLDWSDPKLHRGTHYEYNAEHGTFELARTLQSSNDDIRFFNPRVMIESSKLQPEEETSDKVPAIFDEVLDDAGRDVPWLTKKFHFLGKVTCRQVNAKFFPLDIEALQLRVVSRDLLGVTSLGQERRVVLVDPVLRRDWCKKQLKASRGACTEWALPSQEGETMSHNWRVSDEDGEALGVGEMQLLAVGGVGQDDGAAYTFHIVLRRMWYPRYVFNFVIQNLQVVAALSSLYVPFSDDMLAHRMTVTLLVLLTLVGFTCVRPALIEHVAYPTLHDHYGQLMLVCVLLVGLGNVFASVNCWGMYRAGYDRYDSDLRMIVSDYRFRIFDSEWWCEEGSCAASNFDCLLLYIMLAGQAVICVSVVVMAQMHRITTLLHVKHKVDALDLNPGEYSRLVFFDGCFNFMPRFDLAGCAAYASMLPQVGLFMRAWKLLRRLRQRCFRLCCGSCSSGSQRPRDYFHACEAEDLLYETTDKMKEVHRHLPQISRFHVKLSPYELFRVLDVGSGEIGFYSYWLDQASRCVRSTGATGAEPKLKYRKGMTFVQQFLEQTGGAEELSAEIVKRFDLASGGGREDSTSTGAADCISDEGASASGGTLKSLQIGTPKNGLDQVLPFTPVCGGNDQADGTKSIASALSQTQPGMPKKKRKLLLCFTGSNRQMLSENIEGRTLLQDFVTRINKWIEVYGLECVAYSPEDIDEAFYELWATEWVVQHGDLNVTSVKLGRAYWTLQGGNEEALTTVQEVLREFRDLNADADIYLAYRRAVALGGSGAGEFRLEAKPSKAAKEEAMDPANQKLPQLPCVAFYRAFNTSQPLLRALLRARLFAGTISAGSGSSQVTLRSSVGLEHQQVHSIPLGNRTPLVGMKLNEGHEGATPLSKKLPQTRQLAMDLLCDVNTGAETEPVGRAHSTHSHAARRSATKETRPAWTEDGPVDMRRLELWRGLVETCARERELPQEQRGLFVGISAVFYAAQLAGCAGEILGRDHFLSCLYARRDELIARGGHCGRDLANLVLVIALVEFVLHRTALIVCRRTWRVGELGRCHADFVATWTLGLYLKHSGVMGVPLVAGS